MRRFKILLGNIIIRSGKIFRVRLFTYCLFLILVCLLGIYTVNQKSLQTQAQYKLAKVLEDEQRVDDRLLAAQLELSELLSPENLESYNQDNELGMVALPSVIDYVEDTEDNECAR